MLLGGCLRLSARVTAGPAMRAVAVLGRASLAVYLAQEYVLKALLPALAPRTPVSLGLVLAGLVACLWGFAAGWSRWIGNRVLTLGLAPRGPG